MTGRFDLTSHPGHMALPGDGHAPVQYSQQQGHRLRSMYPAGEVAMSSTYPRLPPLSQDRVLVTRGHFTPAMAPSHVYPAVEPVPGPGIVQNMRRGSLPHHSSMYFAPPFSSDNSMTHPYGVAGPGPPYSHGSHDSARAVRIPDHRPPVPQVSAPARHTQSDSITPTYHGLIKTSTDAILLLAACDLPDNVGVVASGANEHSLMKPSPPPRRIHRRLLEHERPELIRPGSVFVWDEEDAGMRRWTDGRCWSASRVSGCFLTYRELEVRKRPAGDGHGPRANQYKVEGLIKQSFSMTSGSGRKLHIVSYYTKRDLREGTLRRVSEDPRFVGEAGGEWGLSVDEQEFPDPVSDSVPSCPDPSQPHLVGPPDAAHDHGSFGDATSFRTRTAPSSPREVLASSPRWQSADSRPSPTRSFPAVPGLCAVHEASDQEAPDSRTELKISHSPEQRTTHFALHPHAHESGDNASSSGSPAIANSETRPPLKRKRSSSAGEAFCRRPFGPSSLGRLLPGRHGDAPPVRLPGHLLTESNIRGSLGTSMASRKLADPGCLTPISHQEQDSAAGVLLSLRGSHLGSASQNNETPLTTPEDWFDETGTPPEGTPLRKQSSGQGSGRASSPGDRPQAPKRFSSDRDVLSKLSVRL